MDPLPTQLIDAPRPPTVIGYAPVAKRPSWAWLVRGVLGSLGIGLGLTGAVVSLVIAIWLHGQLLRTAEYSGASRQEIAFERMVVGHMLTPQEVEAVVTGVTAGRGWSEPAVVLLREAVTQAAAAGRDDARNAAARDTTETGSVETPGELRQPRSGNATRRARVVLPLQWPSDGSPLTADEVARQTRPIDDLRFPTVSSRRGQFRALPDRIEIRVIPDKGISSHIELVRGGSISERTLRSQKPSWWIHACRLSSFGQLMLMAAWLYLPVAGWRMFRDVPRSAKTHRTWALGVLVTALVLAAPLAATVSLGRTSTNDRLTRYDAAGKVVSVSYTGLFKPYGVRRAAQITAFHIGYPLVVLLFFNRRFLIGAATHTAELTGAETAVSRHS